MWKVKKQKKSAVSEMRKLLKAEDIQKTSDRNTVTKQENEIADIIDGRAVGTKGPRQIDSARKIGQKRSDARSDRYEVECKQTGNQSLSFKVQWLLDITRIALSKKRIPLVFLRFLDVPKDIEKDWVMMPISEFKKLYELAKCDDEVLRRMAGEDWS